MSHKTIKLVNKDFFIHLFRPSPLETDQRRNMEVKVPKLTIALQNKGLWCCFSSSSLMYHVLKYHERKEQVQNIFNPLTKFKMFRLDTAYGAQTDIFSPLPRILNGNGIELRNK